MDFIHGRGMDSRFSAAKATGMIKMSSIALDGESLRLQELIEIARNGVSPYIDLRDAVIERVEGSVGMLEDHLKKGHKVYGVNTGFGGSADVVTNDLEGLQKSLVQQQSAAVLLSSDVGKSRSSTSLANLKSHAVPREIVRGAMAIRANSLLRGHSAVRLHTIANLLALLRQDMIPIVPLRGSISASGDLTPLAYIAGALEGNRDIYLQCGSTHDFEILPADEALRRAQIQPITLQAKEGLGIMNGTAFSCAAAALAYHDAERLMLLTQALTVMCTEALRGTADNFHPFISRCRPHESQIKIAANMRHGLEQSKFTSPKDSKSHHGLYQDRYALRTASQWLAPCLDDLKLAKSQIDVELNSTTDNPLIDIEGQMIHHGGNFQAVSMLSAMEKTRLALQLIGKLIFAQSSELINPTLNGNLSPNLCFDDPSCSSTFKGVDINLAAYMSELAFLANPVGNHVQSAEMHNQAVNSLAFISARYTMDAVELVFLMVASHLYALCQALDLQAMHGDFEEILDGKLREMFTAAFSSGMKNVQNLEKAFKEYETTLLKKWRANKTEDLDNRCSAAVRDAVGHLVHLITEEPGIATTVTYEAIAHFCGDVELLLYDTWHNARKIAVTDSQACTTQYLGVVSRKIYQFVRQDLDIPLHRGLIEHPTHSGINKVAGFSISRDEQMCIGSRIRVIYEALRDGKLDRLLSQLFENRYETMLAVVDALPDECGDCNDTNGQQH